jgi:hypothetical protein
MLQIAKYMFNQRGGCLPGHDWIYITLLVSVSAVRILSTAHQDCGSDQYVCHKRDLEATSFIAVGRFWGISRRQSRFQHLLSHAKGGVKLFGFPP